MSKSICITRKKDNVILLRAEKPEQVTIVDGSWYFHPDCVDLSQFEITDRAYVCPYKGTSLWLDLKIDGSYVTDVAWVYQDPKPKYSKIKGWFGFYKEHRYYSTGECS